MLVGCDPEFYVLKTGTKTIVQLESLVEGIIGDDEDEMDGMWAETFGWDHGGCVAEIRPKPADTTIRLIENIQSALVHTWLGKQLWDVSKYTWRAGAWLSNVDNDDIRRSIGGHVHLDAVPLAREQEVRQRLDYLFDSLVGFGWFPQRETASRTRYGEVVDTVRWTNRTPEVGRMEYRRFPSWLYSKELTTVVLGFSKAAVTKPKSWDRFLTGGAEPGKFLNMARTVWGETSVAAKALLRRDVLDHPDLTRPLQEVWA